MQDSANGKGRNMTINDNSNNDDGDDADNED